MLIQKNTFNGLSSCCPFEKNMLSNVCLGFFGADAILAHAKAWDLVQAFPCPFDLCFNFYTSTGLTAEYPATSKLWSKWIRGYAVNKN